MSKFPKGCEILIIGAGIIGLTIARELVLQGYGDIVILEKESEPGFHASGRNSGVLHAGIYYAPDSLKARSCLNGNRLMRSYCKEKGLPILEAGKVIVTRSPAEVKTLTELKRRAESNGAKVDFLDEKQLAEIEPNARTVDRALYSYYTAVVDPKKVLANLKEDLMASHKAKIFFDCCVTGISNSRIINTTKGKIYFTRLINAAGAYSDRIAHLFDVGREYTLIPFKGIYRQLRDDLPWTVNGNIYPVPDIRNPFLGVHFTRSVNGKIYLGPTAIPAFGRENYGLFSGIDSECLRILYEDSVLFFRNQEFRNVAFDEPKKYLPYTFFKDAAKLVKKLSPHDVLPSQKVGIRAQLVDWKEKKLVMDFLVKSDGGNIHILNPVSPAFTSSMDLAQTVVCDFFNCEYTDSYMM